eukprot:6173061-Pleurochrysis_carterae.AAC.2
MLSGPGAEVQPAQRPSESVRADRSAVWSCQSGRDNGGCVDNGGGDDGSGGGVGSGDEPGKAAEARL